VKAIEEQYFSGKREWFNSSSESGKQMIHDFESTDFQSKPFKSHLLSQPMSVKVELLTPVQVDIDSKPKSSTKSVSESRWNNLDPVDMESVERDHFLKTGQVLRTRYVKAKPSRMTPGSRISQVVGMHIIENLVSLTVEDFGLFLNAYSDAPRNYIFHRDFKEDAQFKICKKILSMRNEDIEKILLPICLALNKFEPTIEIPNRVWRRKIVPVLRQRSRRGGVTNSISPMEILKYSKWTQSSKWALVCSLVLESGRIRLSNRLLDEYLFKELLGDVQVSFEAAERLIRSSVVSCVNLPSEIVSQFIKRKDIPLPSLALLLQANETDLGPILMDRFKQEHEGLSMDEQLIVINAIMSSSSVEDLSGIDDIVTRVVARSPSAVDGLGKVGTVLDSQ